MASFKDLMRAFLYEDVEEDEDDLDEEMTYSQPVMEQPKVSPVVNPAPVEPAPVSNEGMSVNDLLKSANGTTMVAAAMKEAQAPASIFEGLDVTEVSRPEEVKEEVKKPSAYRYDRKKASKTIRRNAGNEDYQAIISPIFGNVADEEKEFDAVHDAINLPRPEEGFDMTMVISPMYGNDKPDYVTTAVAGTYRLNGRARKAAPNVEKILPREVELEEVLESVAQEEAAPAEAKDPEAAAVEAVIAETLAEEKPAVKAEAPKEEAKPAAKPKKLKKITSVADLLTREPVQKPAAAQNKDE